MKLSPSSASRTDCKEECLLGNRDFRADSLIVLPSASSFADDFFVICSTNQDIGSGCINSCLAISVIDNLPMEQRTVFRGCWSPSIGGASNNPWAFIPPPQSTPPPSHGGGGAPPPQYPQQPQQPQQPPNSLIGVVCNNFNKNWDNAKTKKKCKTAISFFRVEPPEGYFRYLYNMVSAYLIKSN